MVSLGHGQKGRDTRSTSLNPCYESATFPPEKEKIIGKIPIK